MKVKKARLVQGEVLAIYDNTAIVFQNGKYCFVDKVDTLSFKKSAWKSILDRLTRRCFLSHVWISDHELCVNFDRKFVFINFRTHNVQHITTSFPVKSLTLFLSDKKEVYFSPYATNRKLKAVQIFKIDNKDRKVVSIAEFPSGLINHVHSFYQLKNGQIFANVGDQHGTMGTWALNESLGKVNPHILNDHLRTVVCEPIYNDKWLTLTDIPNGVNYLRIFKEKPFDGVLELKVPIDGPVIYGQKLKNYFYFSVSGEPSKATFINRWLVNFERRNCRLFRIDLESNEVETIIHAQKDYLPYALFGFGNFTFIPSNSSEAIWVKVNGISRRSIAASDNTQLELKEKAYVAKAHI